MYPVVANLLLFSPFIQTTLASFVSLLASFVSPLVPFSPLLAHFWWHFFKPPRRLMGGLETLSNKASSVVNNRPLAAIGYHLDDIW